MLCCCGAERLTSVESVEVHEEFGQSLHDQLVVRPALLPFFEEPALVSGLLGCVECGLYECEEVVEDGLGVLLVHRFGPVVRVALNAPGGATQIKQKAYESAMAVRKATCR